MSKKTKLTVSIELTDERRKRIGWLLGYYPGEEESVDFTECQDWLNGFIEESVDGIDLPDF